LLLDRLSFGLTEEQERTFRQYSLPNDIRQARIGILLIFIPILVYVFNDYQFFGFSGEFFGLAALRASLAAYSIALYYYLERMTDHRTYDLSITTWLIVSTVFNLIINLSRPQNYVIHVIVVAVFVFMIFLIIPNRFRIQIILAYSLAAGESLIVIFSAQPPIMVLFPILVSMAFVCAIGSISSWQLQDQRRRGYQEIIDRLRAEQALIQEKDRLTSLVDSISDEVWFADSEGRFTLTNPSAAKEFVLNSASVGISVEKVASGMEVLRVDGSPRPLEEAPPLRALKGEVVKCQEEIVRTPLKGELRYRQVSASPVRDANGSIIGSVSIVRDITDSKLAEKERETTIEFLRLVNESHSTKELIHAATAFFQKQSGCEGVGIRLKEKEDYPYYETTGFSADFVMKESRLCTYDNDGQIGRDSDGYPIFECMCGNVIQGRFDPSKPFFTARGSFWTNNTTALLATSTEEDRQSRTRNRCNGEEYESVALIALRVGEETLGLLQLNDRRIGMYSDALIGQWERLAGYLAVALAKFRTEDELKESRRDFESLFYASNEGIALHQMVYDEDRIAIDYRIVKVNAAFEATTGIPKEKATGALASELYGTGDAPYLETYQKVAETGEPASFDEFFPPMGKHFRISAFSPVRGQFATVFVDISALKELEHALKDRADELVRSNEELQQFAYVASHDLQEPLRMVISYLSLLERRHSDRLDSEAKEYMDYATLGGKRMKSLIDDLLEYSRVETKVRLTNKVDMNRIAHETLMIYDLAINESYAKIVLDSLPVVTGDALQLGQVMQNLLANALKFTRPDVQPLIRISCTEDRRRWIFSVKDNGIGMNMDYSTRIFQMFQRLHTPGMYEGTGVGLAIVKKIVERHGGRVWVESEEGVGSTFYFSIPKDEEN
jgi:PAS domain S-box-containing protein